MKRRFMTALSGQLRCGAQKKRRGVSEGGEAGGRSAVRRDMTALSGCCGAAPKKSEGGAWELRSAQLLRHGARCCFGTEHRAVAALSTGRLQDTVVRQVRSVGVVETGGAECRCGGDWRCGVQGWWRLEVGSVGVVETGGAECRGGGDWRCGV
eukprot:366008-Chlamydomonas_euryale.AAC.8